jgi:HSP20 family protein
MEGTVTRYQPRNGATRLPDLVNRLFNESFVIPSLFENAMAGGGSYASLPVSLFQTPDSYIMQAALPGIDAESVDIKVTGREVTLKGQFTGWTPENATPVWQGIPSGQFYETYTLPADLESDKVEATYQNGILTLTLPKAEHLRPRSIKVQVAK